MRRLLWLVTIRSDYEARVYWSDTHCAIVEKVSLDEVSFRAVKEVVSELAQSLIGLDLSSRCHT